MPASTCPFWHPRHHTPATDDETREILRDLALRLARTELYTERITRRLYEILTPDQKEALGDVNDLMGVEWRAVEEYWQEQPAMLASRFPKLFGRPFPASGDGGTGTLKKPTPKKKSG